MIFLDVLWIYLAVLRHPWTLGALQVVRVVTVDGDTGRCKCVLRASGEAIEVGADPPSSNYRLIE